MPTLFDSLHVGALTLPNRIFMAPLTRCRAEAEHVPGDLMAEYYTQRASAGLIITEATMVMEGHSALSCAATFSSSKAAMSSPRSGHTIPAS